MNKYEKALDLLERLKDFCDDLSDIEPEFTEDGSPRPNRAMQMYSEIEKFLEYEQQEFLEFYVGYIEEEVHGLGVRSEPKELFFDYCDASQWENGHYTRKIQEFNK